MLLGSVGKLHWGVDFRGISVGDIHADVVVCTGDAQTCAMNIVVIKQFSPAYILSYCPWVWQ
eukprot:1170412-Amphidinium_carterae.1